MRAALILGSFSAAMGGLPAAAAPPADCAACGRSHGVWSIRGLLGLEKCCPYCGQTDESRVVYQVVEEPVCIPGPCGACGSVRMVRRPIRREIRTRVPTLRWDATSPAACPLPAHSPHGP